jgi:hypothetical protein
MRQDYEAEWLQKEKAKGEGEKRGYAGMIDTSARNKMKMKPVKTRKNRK